MTTVLKPATPSTLDQSLKEISALSTIICASEFVSHDAPASAEKLFTLVRMITQKADAAQCYADYLYEAWSKLHNHSNRE